MAICVFIWPLTSSLSDRDHSTFDFGPGLEYTKVLIISSIILLLGTAILHFLIEYLKTSAINGSDNSFSFLNL